MTDNAAAVWRAAPFRKSSFSGSTGGNCVEVAHAGDMFGVRDSKNPLGPVLAVAGERRQAFLTAVKRDKFSTP
jgi:hypothetical protein